MVWTEFVIRDVKLLHRFCTSLQPEPTIERLLSQCYTQSRQDNKLYFYDYSTRRSGHGSFIKRAKYIGERIPFKWLQLSDNSFHQQFISMLPPHLQFWIHWCMLVFCDSSFRHVRQYMTESQFLKSEMSNYYCSVFHLSKLMALHLKLLRIACRHNYYKISRHDF
jgi:hypothetical protein